MWLPKITVLQSTEHTTEKESNGPFRSQRSHTKTDRSQGNNAEKGVQQVGNNIILQPKHAYIEKNSDTVTDNSASNRNNLIRYFSDWKNIEITTEYKI